MAKWHLNSQGDPGVCKATQGQCPFGQHFDEIDGAREAFEQAASFERQEKTKLERTLLSDAYDDLIELNNALEGKFVKLEVNGKSLEYGEALSDPELAKGNSAFIADYMRKFTDDEERRLDGLPTYAVVSHTPTGALVGTHAANTLQIKGETYVFDYGFAEIDPNAEWPYVGTPEQWRREVDKASVLGAPDKEPEPIDPRSLSIAVYPAGGPNPLLEKAVMEEPTRNRNGTLTRFLSVDQVRVAAIHYALDDAGEPHIHSLETRQEYRHQGYMKKLLKELADEHGIDQVHSSGSMTNDGYTFTGHLTKAPPQGRKMNWANYGEAGKGTFTFVGDWVTGYANS